MASRPRREAKPSAKAKEVTDTAQAIEKEKKAAAAAAKKATPTVRKTATSVAKTKAKANTKRTAAKRKMATSSDDDDNDDNDDDADNDEPVAAVVRPTTKRAAAAAAVAAKKKANAAEMETAATAPKQKKNDTSTTMTSEQHSVDTIIAARQRLNVTCEATRWRVVLYSPPPGPSLSNGDASTSSSDKSNSGINGDKKSNGKKATAVAPLTKLVVGDSSSHYFMVTAHLLFGLGIDKDADPFYNIRVRPLPIDIKSQDDATVWSTQHLRGHVPLEMKFLSKPYPLGSSYPLSAGNYINTWHHAVSEYRRLSVVANSNNVNQNSKAKKAPSKKKAAAGEIKKPFPTSSNQQVSNGLLRRKRYENGFSQDAPADHELGNVRDVDGVLVMNARHPPLYSSPCNYQPGTYNDIDEAFIDLLGDYGYAEDIETRAADSLSVCSGDTQ
jgi:chemotaxis protein histidine kinase CheA